VNEGLMLEHMKASLSELKEKQRICIEQFYLQEKSYEEIAKSTSYTVGEVKSYIQNGKRNLKICMEKSMNEANNSMSKLSGR
jgi:RNA polymerase sigma-70 factor (ECF subfamily)